MKIKYIFVLLCLQLLLACSQPPDFYYLDGKKGYFADYDDKWVIINYWAEWCKPCLEEIPELNAFYQANKERAVILGVNFDRLDDAQIKAQVQQLQISYPVLSSRPAQYWRLPSPSALPATYIIAPTGQMLPPLLGPQSQATLEQAIKNADKES